VWHQEPQARVVALYLGRNQTDDAGFTQTVSVNDGTVGVVLDLTSFYYESGGQIFDTGVITSVDGANCLRVENAQVYRGYVLHMGPLESGTLSVGDKVTCMVDYQRRSFVAP